MEDPDIIVDLHSLNGKDGTRFDVFWDHCKNFLNESVAVAVAVDDHRHCQVTHLTRAISIRDLVEQVMALCPEGTPIPSLEWVRLQFWPKTPSSSSLHYTGRFKLKFVVQQRQWCRSYPDSHYAAAVFRYMREYSILLRGSCLFISLGDKHKIKVGEPHFSVAAAERGKPVLVRDESLRVGDYDFTKFSLVPSVIFNISIPEKISDSCYSGMPNISFTVQIMLYTS